MSMRGIGRIVTFKEFDALGELGTSYATGVRAPSGGLSVDAQAA